MQSKLQYGTFKNGDRVSVRLNDVHLNFIDNLCSVLNVSRSDAIRIILDSYILKNGGVQNGDK